MVKRNPSSASVNTIGSSSNLFQKFGGGESNTADKNFYVPKKLRFSLRAFETVLTIFLLAFLARQEESFLIRTSVGGSIALGFFVAVMCILALPWNVSMYMIKFFMKKWTSRRVLLIETIVDAIVSNLLVTLFIVLLAQIGNQCPAFKDPACSRFHWVIVFTFFNLCFWMSSLVMDIKDLKHGIYPTQSIRELELANRNLERQLRRNSRSAF